MCERWSDGQFGDRGPAGEPVLDPVPRVDFRFAPEPAEPERATVGSTGGEVDEARAGVAQQDAFGGELGGDGHHGRGVGCLHRGAHLDADPAELGIRFIQRPRARRVVGVDHQPHARATARGYLPTVPPAAAFAYLDWPGPIPFAHRGGASEVPENTLPAFEHAVGLGYRYVETDVHVTADGVLLAFHDDVLDRVTDRTGTVSDLPWSVVREARVAGVEPIPLLEELLGTWPDLRVNIDPKHDGAVEALVDTVRRCDAVDRVCVGAFSDDRIARVRAALPGVCTSLGPGGSLQLGLAASGAQEVDDLPAPCAQLPPAYGDTAVVTADVVAEAHRRGMHVHVWTIDEPDEMVRLLDLGVDGIMTDRPAVLKQVLIDRNEWHSA